VKKRRVALSESAVLGDSVCGRTPAARLDPIRRNKPANKQTINRIGFAFIARVL
jgi:hypothetical protein